jgi:fission 1 protein
MNVQVYQRKLIKLNKLRFRYINIDKLVKMATIMLDDHISDAELKKHRDRYSALTNPTEDEDFQFALTLIRSKNKSVITEGLSLFQNLFTRTKQEEFKRDSLYYMAIAQTKLGNYEQAMKYCQTILNVQPTNDQVRDLYIEVNKRMKKDGLIGLGIVGGAAMVGIVGLATLGAALLAKK